MAMERFTINGKKYDAKELDFWYMTILDKNNIDVNNITGMAAINCYAAWCMGVDEETAAKEISAHVIANGGEFPDVMAAYVEKITESDFFRVLLQKAEQTDETEEEETSDENTKTKKVKKEVSE